MACELEVTAPNGFLLTVFSWTNVCQWKQIYFSVISKFSGFVCVTVSGYKPHYNSVFSIVVVVVEYFDMLTT